MRRSSQPQTKPPAMRPSSASDELFNLDAGTRVPAPTPNPFGLSAGTPLSPRRADCGEEGSPRTEPDHALFSPVFRHNRSKVAADAQAQYNHPPSPPASGGRGWGLGGRCTISSPTI